MKRRIAIIAGGDGSAKTICALKPYVNEYALSVIVPMSDSGKSSGALRREFGVLPPGDILRAILALSSIEYTTLKQIFHTVRFTDAEKLDAHNLGNLFLTFASQYTGNFLNGLTALHQAVQALGTAYPVTIESSDLCVELSNGDIVKGEAEIDRPSWIRSIRIVRAWLEPAPHIFDGARTALEEADVILFGPGSLYTSVIATLLAHGVSEAIQKSRATLIDIVGNAFETIGETGPDSLSESADELNLYLPRKTDVVLYNNHPLTEEEKKMYALRGWTPLLLDPEKIIEQQVVGANFEKEGGGLDPEKLGEAIRRLLS